MRLSNATLVLIGTDLLLAFAAWWLAFWLRFNLDIPAEFMRVAVAGLPGCLVAYALALPAARLDRQVWRYIGLPELKQLAFGIGVGASMQAAIVLMVRLPDFPRSVLLLQPMIALMLMGAARAGWRTLSERREGPASGKALVIVGSLQDAVEAMRALKGSQQWRPIGIVSPVPSEVGRSVQDVPVLGTVSQLAEVCEDAHAGTALVASQPGSLERREVLIGASESGIALLTMPRPEEWWRPRDAGPRRIELEDLLGRTPVQLDVVGLAELMSGQTVVVTGAGGSIGSELCRQVARFGVGRLVCVDVSEFAIYALEQAMRETHPQLQGIYYTANVREFERLRAIMTRHKPAVVLHAAAYKHVPLMEEHNEVEALRTNVTGTFNAARAAGECGAQRFVMISTDKAVNPTNVMGASKRLAEMMVQGAAAAYPQTEYVSVRFGNVLGSSGSVVPLFSAQISRGGPVTVTHPEIVRYFMTIPEAAQLVLQAGLMGRSGQIFVLEMGEPVKIMELARMLIRLSGHTEQEIPITFTGLRPGEKLYEELLADDETTEPTPHPKLRVAKTGAMNVEANAIAAWIEAAGAAPSPDELRQWLRAQVPEYSPRPA